MRTDCITLTKLLNFPPFILRILLPFPSILLPLSCLNVIKLWTFFFFQFITVKKDLSLWVSRCLLPVMIKEAILFC